MKVRIVICWILCGGLATVAHAVCVGPSVNSFGAKGDGHSDDTAAIQSAMNAVSSAGGGSVVFGVGRYFTTSTFLVPQGVVLCGSVEGPFDVAGVNPATTTIAPTLLITNTTSSFLTLGGIGAGVTDLLLHYPNQVASSTISNPASLRYPLGGERVRNPSLLRLANWSPVPLSHCQSGGW